MVFFVIYVENDCQEITLKITIAFLAFNEKVLWVWKEKCG